NLAAAQVPGRFDVVQVEDRPARMRSDLLVIRRAPKVLEYGDIVGGTAPEQGANRVAETGEAIDQRRAAPQHTLAVAQRAGGIVFRVSGKLHGVQPINQAGWEEDGRAG